MNSGERGLFCWYPWEYEDAFATRTCQGYETNLRKSVKNFKTPKCIRFLLVKSYVWRTSSAETENLENEDPFNNLQCALYSREHADNIATRICKGLKSNLRRTLSKNFKTAK